MRYFFITCLSILIWSCSSSQKVNEQKLYVGTYTQDLGHVNGNAQGIMLYTFDPSSGNIKKEAVVAELGNPSYLCLSPQNKYLYTVSEVRGTGNPNSGKVVAYKRNKDNSLTKINETLSGGKSPCHVSISEDGNFLFVANYGGKVSMHILHEDGRLGKQFFSVENKGKGKHPRQEASHMHMAEIIGEQLFVTDLGTDLLCVYKVDAVKHELVEKQKLKLPEASGPRHLSYAKKTNRIYVVNELNATVNLINQDSLGMWQVAKTYPTLSNGTSNGACADIHLSEDEKFLYLTNRAKHNSIVVYAVDANSGELTFIEEVSSGGKTPRNFTLSPDGKFLLVANQDSRDIIVFSRNEKTGKLTQKKKTKAETPVCLKFVK